MVIFLNQAMQEKEVFLKKINKIKIFVIIFIFAFAKNGYSTNSYEELITSYFSNIIEFSSYFLQTGNDSVEEGRLFLYNKRIKIEYLKPSRISLVIAEKKAMYYNKDLEEVQYFNPEKTAAKIFFNVFFDLNFFRNTDIVEKNNTLTIQKNIILDSEQASIKIFFERSPLIIRGLEINNNGEITNIGILEINLNPNLDDSIFSLADPTLK